MCSNKVPLHAFSGYFRHSLLHCGALKAGACFLAGADRLSVIRVWAAWVLASVLLVGGMIGGTPYSFAASAQGAIGTVGSVTGLPLPRFVSLKATPINVRKGPSKDHAVEWVFKRKGLPVEVIAEFDRWRRIRDRDGDVGWVYHSLIDGRRTAIVRAIAEIDLTPLYEAPDTGAEVVALAEPGVTGTLIACQAAWCRFSASGHTGWIERRAIWGTYPEENFD